MRQQIADVIGSFRDELDDHRLAINENTSEISSSLECMNEMNAKIEKIAERLDELTLLIKGPSIQPVFEIRPLNSREKEVFQELYVATEAKPFVCYAELARKCGLTKEMVSLSVGSMIRKGVPILKKMNGSLVLLRLDSVFKEQQAKKNLVGVSSLLSFL
ncbi:hypothetical protein KY329_01115 [Candidatus Woesearchaeota archaeon]|nr:hypothetical protein [Candidatus Woesearchaeota archaeon]